MLFMVMHKMDPKLEAGGPPDQSVIRNMGKLIGETIAQGKFHNAAGLKRSAERVRLRFKDGQCEITKGPLRGENELISGFAMIEVKTMDDAISWTKRFADALGEDVEVDVGPVVERWDLGMMEKPANPPLHAISMHKATAKSEAGVPPSPAQLERMGTLIEEMKAAGVFMAAEGLAPSSRGARLRAKGGKHSWTDGPFAESKELISGFTIVKVDSLAEAKAWTERYADALGECEVDVREVHS